MKKQTLHEIAKLCAGLVLADLIVLWWLGAGGLFPVTLLGMTWTSSVLVPGLIFDAALFLILVHYGWNIGKMPALRERKYLKIAGIIFAIVAIVHLIRIFFGNISVIAFGWDIPIWLSWLGVILAGYFSYMSFSLARKTSGKR